MDALMMQNWDHVQVSTCFCIFSVHFTFFFVQFVLSHLNKLPKESRDADFSRIKPWYLDGL